MKAVVMAGGQGTRLRPLTSNQPKPMLPIMGEPMLLHILRLLRKNGFTEVVITVQFLASIIRNFFGDAVTDIDLQEVVRFHLERGAAVTVTLKRVENPLEFGIVIIDEQGRVER